MPTLKFWWPLALVALAAGWLRLHDLAARPMHADEANQAVKFAALLEAGRYAFDPADHHGPTLYYAALPVAWIRGQRTLAQIDETTVRLVTAIAGTIGVLLVAAVAWPLGRWPAFAAAALTAVSPPAVYYSRYFVQETLLVTFMLGALACGARWWRTGRGPWLVASGVCAGLMQATKASAPLLALAAFGALVVARFDRPRATRPGRDGRWAICAAILVAVAFYASFGTHLSGIADALSTYGRTATRLAAGATGHEKPWWYYLRLFAWQQSGGVVFQQVAFSALALVGLVAAVATRSRFLRWSGAYTVLIGLLLSVPAYKTPWHAVHLVPGLAWLAAGALAAMPRSLAPAAFALVLVTLALQTRQAVFGRPADERNPLAYVHSGPDVLKYRPLVDSALRRSPDSPVRVIAEEYWPIPWYLRGLPRVGYWSVVPAECDGALVIASASVAADVRSRLHGGYRESFLGLRPGVVCVIFTPEK
jgi:uncharacterized protein (TIGR03663 family)